MRLLDIAGVKLIVPTDRICISVLGIEDKAARGPLPFEPESLPIWAEICSEPGAHVFDIGAYSGLYSLVARKAGASVTAFEPLAANRARFRENAILNGFPDLHVNSEAVSDTCGTATITYNLGARGLSSGASIVKVVGSHPETVPTVSIDSLACQHVSAMKIDVERAEALVLRGARETIARSRPVLLVEALDDALRDAVLAELPGYRLKAVLDVRNLLLVPA